MENMTFDVFIDFDDLETGVDKISLVKKPAIMVDFIYMADIDVDQTNTPTNKIVVKQEYLQLGVDNEKRIITGPALIPDIEIVRQDDDGEVFNIKYSKEQIEEIAVKFAKLKNQRDINKDHKNEVSGIYIVENWLVGKNDKSKDLGFDLPEGTWMVSMKVENDELWDTIKSGKVKGFSIEGLFKFKRTNTKVEQKKWTKRNVESSNVNSVVYQDETKELVIKFRDGGIYTYFDVDINEFMSVVQGLAECKTEGSNKWGEWYVGKTPSVGAAVWEYLINTGKQYKKGGVLQEKININMTEMILKNGTTLYTEGTFEVGSVVYTMDGESQIPVEIGEYEAEDGSIIVIGEGSIITEIKPLAPEAPAEMEIPVEVEKPEVEIDYGAVISTIMDELKSIKSILESLVGPMTEQQKKLEQMEVALSKIELEKEMKEVDTIDKPNNNLEKEKSDAKYNMYRQMNKKF